MNLKEILKDHIKSTLCIMPFSRHVISTEDEDILFSTCTFKNIRSKCVRCGISLILTKEQDSKDEYTVKEEEF